MPAMHLAGPGLIGTYIHFNNKVGTMLEVETSNAAVADALGHGSF